MILYKNAKSFGILQYKFTPMLFCIHYILIVYLLRVRTKSYFSFLSSNSAGHSLNTGLDFYTSRQKKKKQFVRFKDY